MVTAALLKPAPVISMPRAEVNAVEVVAKSVSVV